MITKLTGLVDSKDANTFVLDVNGVGYLIYASKKTTHQLPNSQQQISIFIEHIFRQDDQMLCGFLTTLERDWFRLLVSVQGVGTKVALSILSFLSPDEIADCIARQHSNPFTQADGVGAKVAGRITLELKGKIPSVHSFVDGLNDKSDSRFAAHNYAQQDAISALSNLGYTKTDANIVVQNLVQKNPQSSTQDLVREGLKALSVGRR